LVHVSKLSVSNISKSEPAHNGHYVIILQAKTKEVSVTLSELLTLVKTNWPFDATNYPQLEGATADQILQFAARHVQMHAAQTVGSLAAECEDADHSGEAPSKPVLVMTARQLMVHAICLANLVGLSPEELEKELIGWATGKKPSSS
jgi:hypothetical protein